MKRFVHNETRGVVVRYPNPGIIDFSPLKTLYPVDHTNRSRRWCGPSALAAITGLDTETVTRIHRRVNHQKQTMGVHTSHIRRVLHRLGYRSLGWYDARPPAVDRRPTFAAWLRGRPQGLVRHTVLVVLGGRGGHYVVVRGHKAVDSWRPEPVWISNSPHRKKRMRHVLVVGYTKGEQLPDPDAVRFLGS